MIDMSIEGHADEKKPDQDYSKLFSTINGKPYSEAKDKLTKEGPIVNVLRASKGVKITGKGAADEVDWQVDQYLDQITKDQQNTANQIVSNENKQSVNIAGSQKTGKDSDDSIDKATMPT